MIKEKSVLVLGAGAFGTSLASVVSHNFQTVYLKVRRQEQVEDLKKNMNSRYFGESELPSNIEGVLNFDQIKHENVGLVISGLPTKALKIYFNENQSIIKNYLETGVPFVSLSKGIDPETLELPDDILFDVFNKHDELFTFLSGPSFAKEIVEKQITMVSLAGKSRDVLDRVSAMLSTDYFKVIPTYDVKGVLLGGALKNILAIAGGLVEGLGYNHNTRAAMITRGIVEMLRFGEVFNARPETFYGLSGMGDLILTTTGSLSRNKKFGLELAKGRTPEEVIASVDHVVEGYKTTKAAHLLASKYQINARLFNGIYRILYENVEPREILDDLMGAPIKFGA